MLCLKKVYRDELLQLALLLSILRVNNDSFYDNIFNNLDFDNGTSWRSITPAFLRSQYVSPKSLDSVLLNYQRDLFADLNSLGRFNGGNFRHPDVTTYLLNIDRTAPTSNADSLPVANAPGSQNQSESTVNEEEANSLDFGISLSQEDMDLIEVLWKQDVDLGFTVDNIKPEKEDIKTEPDEKVTPVSAADKDDIEKLKTLQAINDDSIKQEKEEDPWSGFDYTIDTETGEYVIKTEVDSETSGEEVSNPVDLGLEDFTLPLPEFFLDEALRLIDLEDETSQENTINLKELDSLQSEAGSPSAASAAAEAEAAGKTDDISPPEEALHKDDQDDEFDFLNMIQTPQFHHPHHRAPFQSRMPFVRTMSMEQRWQDLASLLSLPSHENGGIHHPFSHHHHALHNYTHHPHPHSMGYSPEAARGVLLHNATLPTPIGDLNSSVPYNNLARKHPTYGVWASSLHKVYDYNLPRWPDGGSEDEDCNGGTNFGSAVASSMNLTNSSEPMGESSSTPHYKLEPSHDMVYYQNGSSEINQTDGFLSSILNDEDLQLMDMAMNEGMYTMRMLDGNSTVNNIGSTNNTNITMSRNEMERMDTSSDSAVSSMGSERVPSLSDGEWGDGGSDSGHTSTEHYVTDYTTKLRPYDYSYSNRQLNNGIGGNDNARIQPVAQKKHQMYGKRFFQDHNSSNSSQSPATPLKYEYREPASSYNISNQSEGAVGPKVPEMKYSCSMEFGHLNRNPVNHIQHNHTYHLPAESSGVMQRPVLRDKSKQKKIEDEHLTRDEKRARALNVPISVDDIINLPMDEYNERLSKYDLSEAQLSLIRDIRRRGKNKVAAQNCRKRKLDQILSLADEVKEMKDRKLRLITDHEYIKNECRRYRDKYQQLYRHVFQNLRDPDGNQYSPYQWSLQTSADGSIILVPRSNSSVSSQDPKDPLQNHKEP